MAVAFWHPDGEADPTDLPLARRGSFGDESLVAETSSYQCPRAHPRAWQTALPLSFPKEIMMIIVSMETPAVSRLALVWKTLSKKLILLVTEIIQPI